MNTNTKELLEEIEAIAGTGVELSSLLECLADMAHQINPQLNDLDKKRLEIVSNGLHGAIKLLDSGVLTKLYDLQDDYDSITGTPIKKQIGA